MKNSLIAVALFLFSISTATQAATPMIAAGDWHTCALTSGGGVKCWGSNSEGQLGDGSTADRLIPVDVVGLSSGVSAIAAGGSHTCALTSGGGLKCWGNNSYGELGDGSTMDRLIPVDVTGLTSGVSAIAAGGGHTCSLTTGNSLLSGSFSSLLSGSMFCWGNNSYGQLGDGSTMDRLIPVDVTGLTSGVREITAGYYHTCALAITGNGTGMFFTEVKCWGNNNHGQLGNGSITQSLTPVNVTAFSFNLGSQIKAEIKAGGYHTCATNVDYAFVADVQCWGNNIDGQLGDGSNADRHSPVDVVGLSGLKGVPTIIVGTYHTCALYVGVKCWGYNKYGQLGDGSTTNQRVPVGVSGLTSGVSAITAGTWHTCALTDGGGVKCWGYNKYGQLGDGTTTDQHTPVDVAGLTLFPTVVEFYNTKLDHYFITADPGEATGIDSGNSGSGWSRTGNTFTFTSSHYADTSVCRFYGSQSPGPNSHFYTADTGECAYLKQLEASTPDTQPRWNYEGIAFAAMLPANGTCSSGTVPVYRAYNKGPSLGKDSNHRITANLAAIQQVVAQGWDNEGVVMCASSASSPPTVTAFVIPSTSTSLTVQITTLTATDDVGVTGYMVTESSTAPSASSSGWTPTKPPPYHFATEGTKTLYAWAKDGSGLVSVSKIATVTVTAPAVSGRCGSSDGSMLTTEPSGAALCSVGKPSNVSSASSFWSWTCYGTNNGTSVSCSANKPTAVVTPPSTGVNGTTWTGNLGVGHYSNVLNLRLVFTSDNTFRISGNYTSARISFNLSGTYTISSSIINGETDPGTSSGNTSRVTFSLTPINSPRSMKGSMTFYSTLGFQGIKSQDTYNLSGSDSQYYLNSSN